MRSCIAALVIAVLILACGGADDTNKPPPISSALPSPTATPGSGPTNGSGGVQTFPDQGRDHVRPGGGAFAYNSSPPTSGPHSSAYLDPGVYADQSPPEALIA